MAAGVRTRRARQVESRLLAAQKHASASGPLVRLSEDLLCAVLRFCDGATLGRLERTCRLFHGQQLAPVDGVPQSIPERVAAFQMGQRGLGAPSLWAQSTGASHKHQLWRAQCPASQLRRFPVKIPVSGGSPAFGPRGELWMADYMGKCIKQIGWKVSSSSSTNGRFAVTRVYKLPAAMRSTAAAVAVSSDGLRLAVTVQPPYYQDGHGSHGFLILCARTGATLASYLDGNLPGDIEDQLEYPSAVDWLSTGTYAGELAIADYNNGRVQIRSAETGELKCNVPLEDTCVSGVAELKDDNLAVVPHSSDAVAVFDISAESVVARSLTRNLSNQPHLRWFGHNECGMPIAASGVDNGQTLAVSDGAHRCVLFFEQAVAATSRGVLRARRSRAKGPVSVAVDYCSGEVVEKQDRARPRQFERRPHRQWRRLRVDTAGLAGDTSDDEDFSEALLDDDDCGDPGNSDGEDVEVEDNMSDEDEEDSAEEHGGDDSDEDSDEDDASLWGKFGIWTSLGFDHKRGDMVVSDSGTRYSDASVWLS